MPNPTQTVHIELERGEAEASIVALEVAASDSYHDQAVEDAEGDYLMASANKLRAALSSSPEIGRPEIERIARKAFIAGGTFVGDSTFKDRRGNFHAASTESLVEAALDYSKEAS